MNVNFVQSSSTTNECVNYCSSGGVCLKTNSDPKCICLPKWTGERCDIPEKSTLSERLYALLAGTKDSRNDPCDSAPANFCEHNGFCFVNTTGSSKVLACHCRYPYVGDYCERVSECDGYCMNSGTCVADADGTNPKCTCSPEWDDGKRCQNPPTPTTLAPGETTTTTTTTTTTALACAFLKPGYCNSGTCVSVNNQAQCSCPLTHTGPRCETPTEAASSSGTTSSGTMLPGTTPPGTTQSTGSSTMAPERITCDQKPCKNGSRCYPNGNTVFCLCDSQHTGPRCENSV